MDSNVAVLERATLSKRRTVHWHRLLHPALCEKGGVGQCSKHICDRDISTVQGLSVGGGVVFVVG